MSAISIAWQSSDLARFKPASAPVLDHTPASTSLGESPHTHTRSSVNTSSNSSRPSDSSKNSTGLSTGAKAGIGIGIAAFMVGVIALAYLILLTMRKRRRQKIAADEKAVVPSAGDHEHIPSQQHRELDGRPRYEADGRGLIHEVENRAKYEMDGKGLRFELMSAERPRWELDSR